MAQHPSWVEIALMSIQAENHAEQMSSKRGGLRKYLGRS